MIGGVADDKRHTFPSFGRAHRKAKQANNSKKMQIFVQGKPLIAKSAFAPGFFNGDSFRSVGDFVESKLGTGFPDFDLIA